ncbi:uncharacterized protein LOC141666094 [Apium graveolens]|uniref:uncharacterized protein LOC141666094 n=1 Tax=Apium graveolens TaxID=4045 RepID=UPI003D7BF226
MCLGADRVKTAKIRTLKAEFEALCMKETEPLDDFCTKLNGLVTTIRALGEEVKKMYIVKKLLRAVTTKFLQIASAIKQFRNLETMTVEERSVTATLGLRYLVHTRPDIAYSVGVVSRYMEKPTLVHQLAAKRILLYIKGTLKYGLVYTVGSGSDSLSGYSDSFRLTGRMCFASSYWWSKFPLCTLTVFHAIVSDHEPLKLELLNSKIPAKQFRFRFENTWLKESTFHAEVSNFWHNLPSMHLLPKLIEVSKYMAKWGRGFFHKFREKVAKQKETIDGLKNREDDDGVQMYFDEKDRLEEILSHEEAYWKQRAKSFWLKDGDTNSKYFHVAASSRKKLNYLTGLKNAEGILISNHEDMCELLKYYFNKVFTEEGGGVSNNNYESDVRITCSQNASLTEELSFTQFTQDVKSMHPDKASGPDGLNPAFFQQFWDMLGTEVYKCCKQWLVEGAFSSEVNDTTLVLIPKKDNIDDPKDLRPIALCNVLYKILAKILANHLQKILPDVISEEQSAFVPGRNISDNVLVAFEVLHYMKRKNSGAEGEVALKLNISKAYDRVNWNYLRDRMVSMGFSEKWIKWVMLCVTTVSYSISFQGSLIGPIIPTRGLRQGDPLSPYLFLLCVEGLSNALKTAGDHGQIHGCQICEAAPSVTHLLFADDNFLFFKATANEASIVKNVLDTYENWSGQAVNYQKSAIFFSSNVRIDKQQEIMEVLGVHNDIGESKYLGLPSLIGRSKKLVFKYLKDKVINQIKSWSAKLLSRAGKLVLLKNVVQAIPAYAMSCFLLPKSIGQEIQKIMNAFWWQSNSANSKGIRWLAWERMCMSKESGGLGFRDIYGFNLALLGKQCWSLIKRPNALVTRVLKARYYPSCHILDAKRTGGVSYTWSSIWEAKEEMKKGLRWVLGDSESINIGSDRWLRSLDTFCANASTTRAILNTRIPQNGTRDRIAWVHTTNGQYSVKSAYYQWSQAHSVGEEISRSVGWKRLWQLPVPHKIRVFIWRLCRNTIPVRYRLSGKGVPVTISCSVCIVDVEHLRHLFFECSFARECWQLLDLDFDMYDMEYVSNWLVSFFATGQLMVLVKMAAMLWGIWYARNKCIFEGKVMTPAVVKAWCLKQVDEWQAVNIKSAHAQNTGDVAGNGNQRWKRPREGHLKVNVDAAVTEGQGFFSVGMVLREVTVFEAEATGILEAVLWAREWTADLVTIESDSLLSVNAVNQNQNCLLELGDFLQYCRELLRSNGRLVLCHVKKHANKVVHQLAKFPCEPNSFIVYSSPPSLMLETLVSDDLLF